MATLPVMGYVVGGALSTSAGGSHAGAVRAQGARSSSGWWWRWLSSAAVRLGGV